MDTRYNNKDYKSNRSPRKTNDSDKNDTENDSKSKSLPPSKVQENNRRSNSRSAVSQSKDAEQREDYYTDRPKETADEREEREFQERLRRAETQEDRERMLARRKKFMNTSNIYGPMK